MLQVPNPFFESLEDQLVDASEYLRLITLEHQLVDAADSN